MNVAKLSTCFAAVALAFAAAAGAGGCEAIVTTDVPAYTCSMTPYTDPGSGSCPAGMFCEGAGCQKCNAAGDDPCDGYDNDCNGKIDDGPKSDHDGDGYPYCGNPASSQAQLQQTVDCNDDDKTINPKGHEVCNGKDDNCDGIIDNANLVCPADETCVPASGQCISNTAVCVACSVSNTAGCCDSPNVCDPQTQQCVTPASQEAGSTACTSNEQCNTGICATSTELGSGQTSVCTQPCCTSSDCDDGYVCFGAGTGGNYCVAAANRGALGTGAPGASCSSGEGCRSGVCTTGKCEDTCCSASNCTNGTSCSVTTFQNSTTFACVAAPGNTATNKSCNSNADCASGFCQSYQNGLGETVSLCIPSCCSSKQCGSYEGETQFLCYDDYLPPATSGPVVPVCDYPQPTDGPALGQAGSNVGDPCTKNSNCYSNRCLIFSTGQFCSDVCCVDSDCATAGWVCQPFADGPDTSLRCVPKVASSQ